MARERRAPRPASSALESLAASLAPRTLLAEAQRAWPDAVGPHLAAQLWPVREHGGTLVVRCSSAVWASELELSQLDVLERLRPLVSAGRLTAIRAEVGPRS